MSTIVTRAGKGSALTWAEGDANITNLNTDKYQSGDNAILNSLSVGGVAAGAVAATSLIVNDGTGADPSLEIGTEGNGFWAVATDEIAMSLNGTTKYYYNGTTNYTVMGINAAAGAWGGAISPVSVLVVGDTSALMSTASTTKLMYNTYFDTSYNLVYRNSGMSAGYLDFGGAQLSFFLGPSGTAGNTIVFSNPLRIDETDVELLCGQLKFPAVQIPSADANTLDDYEEGSWVPTVTAQTGSLTSSSLTSATYTKTGRQVTASVNVTITDAGTGSGSLLITLPFTAMAQAFVGSGYEGALTGNMLWNLVGSAGTQMQIRNYNNTTCIATSAQIIATVTYFV